MKEFKAVSFVIIDSDGKTHRIALDKIEGDRADYTLKGNPKILLKRWHYISSAVEHYLQQRSE